jgi:hypothetical protein
MAKPTIEGGIVGDQVNKKERALRVSKITHVFAIVNHAGFCEEHGDEFANARMTSSRTQQGPAVRLREGS